MEEKSRNVDCRRKTTGELLVPNRLNLTQGGEAKGKKSEGIGKGYHHDAARI